MIENTTSGATITRSSLNATTGRIAAVATALFLVLFLVLSVSRAAFMAQTVNDGNFVTTNGAVSLADNDKGDALFELTDASPGVVTTKCISVQYAGEFNSGDVNMYATVVDQTAKTPPLKELASYLNVTVRAVAIDDLLFDENPLVSPGCTLFDTASAAPLAVIVPVFNTAALSTFPTSYATGKKGFDGEASTYAFEIKVEVQNNPNAAAARADWKFTWETQSA